MTSEEARIGLRVKVREGHRSPHLRGKRGTITHRWGAPNYVALDVRLEDDNEKLFWHHELEEITGRNALATRRRRSDGRATLTATGLVQRKRPASESETMGESLYVAASTVRTHVKSIYRKLGVSTRKGAVDEAHARGLI